MKFLQKNSLCKNDIRVGKGLVLMLILSLSLSLCACLGDKAEQITENDDGQAQENADGNYYEFRDANNQWIVLPDKPQKVAVLFSSYADVWVSAGGEVAITVGETVERGFADETVTLVDDGAGKMINTEVLIASQPDFVICSADIEAQVEVAELLNKNGIPAACFRVDNFSDYLDMLKICTDITQDAQAYKINGTDVKKRIDGILEEAQEKTEEKRILFIRAGASASSTKAKTANENFVCAMLAELGTKNIADDVPVLLDGLSIEEILLQNPDYIFVSTMGKEQAAIKNMNEVFSGKQWQALDAIKNENYTFLPKELFQFKPNARWAEAYEYLMDILYE